jgi:hypothetical protein
VGGDGDGGYKEGQKCARAPLRFSARKKNARRDYRYECRAVLNKLSERGCRWRLKHSGNSMWLLYFPPLIEMDVV